MYEALILFGLLFVFIAIGMEIPIALGAAVFGAVLLHPFPLDPIIITQKSVGTMARAWPLLTIPIFIMIGEVFRVSGISHQVVQVANILVGRLPGGLAVVNIISSYFFGGISGSASADTSAIGSIMIPMMKEQGYGSTFSTVVTITSSTLGPIVPPSILIILIAWVTDQSVGNLFLAGYLPALATMLGLVALSIVVSVIRRYPRHKAPPFIESMRIIASATPALITPFIIVGGIVSGIVTVVESSAVALAYTILIAVLFYHRLGYRDLIEILRNTVQTTAFVGLLLAFASAFAWYVTFSGIPVVVAEWLIEMNLSPVGFMLVAMVIYLVLGTFLNAGEIVLIAMPIMFPAALALNIDPIHFSLISALSMVIGNVTPPVGLSLFIGCAISGDRVEDLIRPLVPFVAVMIGVIVYLIIYPEIVLWLPEKFGYVPK